MTLFLPWLIAALAARVGVAAQQETCHESDSDCVGAASRSLLQRKQRAAEQATTVAEVDLATAFSKLTDVASQLKGEVEQLKEGLEVEHAEVLTLRHMLSESNGQKVDSGKHVHVHAETDEKDQSFELCRASGNTLGQVEVQDNQSLYEGTSCGSSEVLLFSPKDSSPYFETQCCPISKEHCAGCAKQNSAKTSCSTCRGGFTRTSAGNCLACVDLPWENKAGQNCVKASCSDEKFNGFSSNEACCKCGAGQKAATSFAYYVGPLALGSSSVVGHPVPRTASHYSVDKDCELAKYGLMINPSTGALGLISGCSTVGCGAQKSIEVRCTVTAEQEDGLTASAPLEVLAGGIGYGSVPVVLRGTTKSSGPAVTSTGSSGSYKISCAPAASSWLNIDSSGKLALKSGQSTGAGGVTGSDGKMGEGGVCSVQKGTAKGSVVVVAPTTWSSLSYSYGSRLLYVTVGEKSPILSPTKRTGLKPTRFSADCKGSAFTFDVLSGIATWEGHQIFSLNTATGDLQLSPEESLTKTLDSKSDTTTSSRRSISTACTIFGHYEWAPTGHGPILTHRLNMEFRDHTCWAYRSLNFARRATKSGSGSCRSKCRSEAYCSHYRSESGTCYFYSGVCTDSSNFACKYKNIGVLERYPGCGERNGCMHLELKGHHYLSGRYCPGGENVASSGQGPVYFKKGLIQEESFWLMRYDTKGGCSSGDWAIYKAKPEEDYENSSMAYVELHGDAVACVKGSTADLVTDVFGQTKVDLTVSKITTSKARATVSAPGCVAPNVTAVDGPGDQPVDVLILDDPSTDIQNDHWLHPCDCVPATWGSLPPVSGEAVADIPAGSNNEFMAAPMMIVDGQFVCQQAYLTNVFVESETDGLDAANCKTRCIAQKCPYYWEGEVMSTKQCRLYSQCTELVREIGVVGNLYGMSYRKACKVADAQLCWKVTKRRSFLGAGDDSYQCFHQDLIEQCDQKLMLGGLGVSACGGCEYAPVKGKQILDADGECMTASTSGGRNVYVAACNNGDNQKWYFDGENLKSEAFTSSWCLDMDKMAHGNVYMANCHTHNNQKWYFIPAHGHLKSRDGNGCVDSLHAGNKNIYVGNCPWSDKLQWTWRQTVHGGQQIVTDEQNKCLIHDTANHNVFIGTCTVDYAHRWYWDGERLKSESTTSKCLDANGHNNLYMGTCHSGNNQKWYFDGKLLKSRDDSRCVDFDPDHGNNLVRANCPDSNSKKWAWGSEVAKSMPAAELTCMQNNKCLDDDGSNVYMTTCHGGNNQLFYFDGKLIKVKSATTKCLDEPASGSLYMHTCHGNDNQEFYWSGHQLKNDKWGNAKCVDKSGGTGEDIYMGSCHSGSNQVFNFKVPRRFKTKYYPNDCLEWTSSSDNVALVTCDSSKDKQLFFFDGPQLKSKANTGKCLHRESNKNLKMANCQDTSNQKFVWDGERVKVQGANECIDAHTDSGNNNVYLAGCHSSNNQKWYFDQPVEKGKSLRSGGKCMEIQSNRKALWKTCTDASNQRFYFSGEAIKVESVAGCLDSYRNEVKLHVNCNGHSNQKWYWSGQNLKSKKHNNCLDVWPNNNTVFMGSCPGKKTQQFTRKSQLNNGVQLTVGGGRCMSRATSGNNVLAVGCAADARQMWYFSGLQLKNEHDGMCLDLNGGTGNLDVGNCLSNRKDQQFYFSGNSLRDKNWGRCLEYNVDTGSVFSGTCPDQKTHMWRLDSLVALRKTPLPAAFQHGQSLEAKCWSERFTPGTLNVAHSRTMSCVAGAWVNSWNTPGLEGFTCTACVQVVSKVYADLDAQIRQELFFASGMKLTISVDTRTRRTVTSTGSLRAGGTSDVFIAEILPDAAETMRRYRSVSSQGKCLKAANVQLGSATCADEAEPEQMIEANELGSLLWDEFKAGASVPTPSGSGLYSRGTGPTTLRSFKMDADCGQHVMASVKLSHNSLLGMSATCTAASTYGSPVQHTIPVPGAVTITSVSEGTCMSINRIIPWRLIDQSTSGCMDDSGNSARNVYVHSCHTSNNQLWYMLDGNIFTLRDHKCLDYSMDGSDNVYMHECHDGENQKWYFDEDTKAIRSEKDHRCLDRTGTGSDGNQKKGNLYVHDCHFQTNQQFVREERAGNAFTMALHLDCTDSDAQQITVEPSGGGNSFKLRRSPHTLPNDWKYDSDKKTIKKTSGNKCLEARGRGRVEEVDCSQRIEQEWTMSHGLPGLVDAPISCPGDQVISYMKKTHSQIQYKCSHVSSLGMCSPHYSTQVETKSPELETIKALRQLGAFCPPGEGLKSFESEASDKGAWIRFKYECCQISRVPVSIYPLMTGAGKRDFDTGMAQAWEGIYCPSGSTNGRVDFTQSRSFKPGQSASGTLKYDKNDGKWCVSGKDCAYSDVVHPLDLQLHTSQWYVVPVSDFDAIFEARGAKTTPKKKRKPPPLIKFGASDPEYLPECKDESHPGARKFKLASMNEEAKELDDENPCKYVYGAPPTNQDMDGADGMTGWIDDLVDTVGPGQGGVTYKSVKECSDRDIVRELQMAKWSQAHNYHTMGFDYARDLIMAYADGMPEVEAAPIGAGFEFQPGSILAAYSTWYFNTIQLGEDIAMQQHEMHFEQAGHDDCNPIQHGFARTFCDLHCIRDAVRKGDDAILRALEEAVEIIGKNTQLLLEHYVGEESGSLLVEEASKIRRGLATQFQELRAVAQEAALETRASLAGARAIKAFAGRWRHQGNVSGLASLRTMAGEVAQLHSTVTAVSSQKLSRVEEMQQNSLETVAYMNKFLKARAHVLGLYHQTASRAKTAQTWFKQHWTSKMSVLDELRDASVAQALETFDTMWWQVRRKLDAYLDAADDHTRAMSHAVDSLRSYAGQCHASFVQLKKSYAASIRAEKHDHATLKSTWSEMAIQVGMIASKIVDAKLLDQLALADAKVAKQPDVGKAERATICGNSSAALMSTRAHLAEAMTNGFLGQTQNQLSILFGEMAMLQQRYHAALGEAPGAEEVRLAQGRLSAAMKAARLGVDNLATSIAEHWRSHLCK